jgi:hypothetical protein
MFSGSIKSQVALSYPLRRLSWERHVPALAGTLTCGPHTMYDGIQRSCGALYERKREENHALSERKVIVDTDFLIVSPLRLHVEEREEQCGRSGCKSNRVPLVVLHTEEQAFSHRNEQHASVTRCTAASWGILAVRQLQRITDPGVYRGRSRLAGCLFISCQCGAPGENLCLSVCLSVLGNNPSHRQSLAFQHNTPTGF